MRYRTVGHPGPVHEFHPDPADEALLRFVLADDGDHAELLLRWRELVELDDASSASHHLLPTAYLRMEICAPDDRDLGRLRGIYRQRWVTRQRHIAAADRAMQTLGVSGVRFLGPADQDAMPTVVEPLVLPLITPRVTVPERQIPDALDALLDAGWQIRQDDTRSSVRRRLIQSDWELDQGTRSGSHVVIGAYFNPVMCDVGYERAVWGRSTAMVRGRCRPASTDLFFALLTEASRDQGALRWAIGSLAVARHTDGFPDAESVLANPALGHLLPMVVSRLEFLTAVDPDLDALDRTLEVARASSEAHHGSRSRTKGLVARQWMHRSRQARVLAASVRRHGGVRKTVGYLRATRR